MEREAINALIAWKNKKQRKPLIMKGARQVGKTWLIKHFAETEYEDSIYISFDRDKRMVRVFEPDLDPHRIIRDLEDIYQKKIDPNRTLVIFDEIQELPVALTSLKYFYEDAPQYQIVCAGSLLGIALHEGTSFPVGKVEFLEMFPLSFPEFLIAMGETHYANLLKDGAPEKFRLYHEEYVSLLKKYYYIGGMPAAVDSFVQNRDFAEVRRIQQDICLMYDQDFSKHAPPSLVPRIRMLWDSIPAQLAKDNKKFVYNLVSTGARAREYEAAILWLLDTGIALKANRVAHPGHPLKAFVDMKAFKLFACDIGLLCAMSELTMDMLFERDDLFSDFKGALTEQYVMQQLVSTSEYTPYYWSKDNARSEVDFLIQVGKRIVPIEAKAGINLRAKSLRIFIEKYKSEIAIRTSLADYKISGNVIDIPLYAISMIDEISFIL
ncbi:MAG: AAA family ATPase [Clostridiales Family XIII bacterium]|nr:AAA family ATPase [Clostridiales Family XIII bacterium]